MSQATSRKPLIEIEQYNGKRARNAIERIQQTIGLLTPFRRAQPEVGNDNSHGLATYRQINVQRTAGFPSGKAQVKPAHL